MKKDMDYTKEIIVAIARDTCLNKVYPTRTNSHNMRAFRDPEDGQPFGFCYNGVYIEVHVKMVRFRMKGTAIYLDTPIMSIYGLAKDGRGLLIVDNIYVTEELQQRLWQQGAEEVL
jgi:hypothetical protein